jgi:uncharacterized protein HemX
MFSTKPANKSKSTNKRVNYLLYILVMIFVISLSLSGYVIYTLKQDNIRLSNELVKNNDNPLIYEKYLEYQLPRERERANQTEKELTELKNKYSDLQNNCKGSSETNTVLHQNNSIKCTTNKIGDYIYTNCR